MCKNFSILLDLSIPLTQLGVFRALSNFYDWAFFVKIVKDFS